MKKLFLVLLILSSVVVKLTYDFFPIKYYNDVVEEVFDFISATAYVPR